MISPGAIDCLSGYTLCDWESHFQPLNLEWDFSREKSHSIVGILELFR